MWTYNVSYVAGHFEFAITLHKNISVKGGPGNSVGIATGYGMDGPGIESRWRARFSALVQTGARAHPASCIMGTESLPGIMSGQGMTLTPHSLLVSWSRKGRAIPLLLLWAIRPVRSLSACTRVTFTLLYFRRPGHQQDFNSQISLEV